MTHHGQTTKNVGTHAEAERKHLHHQKWEGPNVPVVVYVQKPHGCPTPGANNNAQSEFSPVKDCLGVLDFQRNGGSGNVPNVQERSNAHADETKRRRHDVDQPVQELCYNSG